MCGIDCEFENVVQTGILKKLGRRRNAASFETKL